MKHDSYDPTCGVCKRNAGELPAGETLWEDDLWLVRHADPPNAIAGWMTLYAKRHVAGLAHFNDEEATSIGNTLRRLELTLEEVTGALRIYSLSMNESFPHFHCHMVPRYANTPGGVSGFGLLNLGRGSSGGEDSAADPAEVERISLEFRKRLAAS